jgi:UDPglucose 6-dehydrogenase
MRMAPSITIINALLEHGAAVQAFDPKADGGQIWGDKVKYAKNAYEALEGVDCLLLLTEWNEFRRPDFDRMKSLMKSPVIFDGRNQYDAIDGFEYHCVGKPTTLGSRLLSQNCHK